MDLDLVIQKLSEATGLPFDQIKTEIQEISDREGVTLTGAAQIWKSEPKNKAKIPRAATTYFGRAMLKTDPRGVDTDNGPSVVQDIQMIVREANSKDATIASVTLWGEDRIKNIGDLIPIGQPISFSANENKKGKLINVRNVVNVGDDAAPKIDSVKARPIDTLGEALARNEFVRGWVGRVISGKGSPDVIGFELGDMGGVFTVPVWFAGEYSKMDPAEIANIRARLRRGVEVSVFGYVAGTTSDVRINASSVFFHD